MIKLMRFLQPYRGRVAVMLFLLFFQMVGTLYIPTLTASMVNNGIITGDLAEVWRIGLTMLLVALITALVSIVGTYLSSSIATSMGSDIRGALFKKTLSLSTDEYNRFGAPSLITRSTSDVTSVQQTFSMLVEMLLPAPFIATVGLVLAFSKNKLLSFIILGAMIFILLSTIVLAKKAVVLFEKMQTLMDQMNKRVRESIIGVRVIRAFNRTEQEKELIDESFTAYADTAIKANKIFAVMMPLVMGVMNFSTLLILWFGGKEVAAGQLQIGDIMAVIEYAMLIIMYLVMGVAVFMMVPRAQTSAMRINEVLDIEPEQKIYSAEESKLTRDSLEENIVSFENVTFRYKGAEEAALEHLSFVAKRGETTAIIGGTGSGKSSIASLLMRFYDVESGSIKVDGKDIRTMSQASLREKIGYVPQKAFLFSGSLEENLRHGRSDATEEELFHALEVAQMAGFVEESVEGLAKPLSQGGNNLSGGQKQRLSIARAVIKNPDILLFDDSFSALDAATDVRLRAALKKETNNSAVIIVAQRISSIMDADNILVLEDGQLVDQGTHKELMECSVIYQEIARSQMREEESA